MRSFLARGLAVLLFLPILPTLLLCRACMSSSSSPAVSLSVSPRVDLVHVDTDTDTAAPNAPASLPALSAREQAEQEIAFLQREIHRIDALSGQAFSQTLREVLVDPARSVAAKQGPYRLPRAEGMDALLVFLPPAHSDEEDESRWAFIWAASLLESSAPGAQIDNYLVLDACCHVRQTLFPSQP